MIYKLARDVHLAHCWPQLGGLPCPATFPAGTIVVPVEDGRGVVEYAIRGASLVARLTGNSHDAKHRYCTVPADAVTKG